MAKSKEYIAIKNFLHNERGMTREAIEAVVVQAITAAAVAEARRYIQSLGPDFMDKQVASVLTKEINSNSYNSLRKDIMERASKFIAEKMQVSIKP